MIITEAHLRQVISEELQSFLVEEGLLGKIYDKIKLPALLILVALMAHPSKIPEQVMSSAMAETPDQYMERIFTMTDTAQNRLISAGVTAEQSTKIVAGVLAGVRQQEEQKLSGDEDNEEDAKEQSILARQIEELKKLDNIDVTKEILVYNFQNTIEQSGRKVTVAAHTAGGGIGTPVPIRAMTVGLGYELQKTLILGDIPVKTGNGKIVFNPIDLDSYWKGIIEKDPSSEISKSLSSYLGNLSIPSSDYQFAAGEATQADIKARLQKENKIMKLKRRLNEMRGLYV